MTSDQPLTLDPGARAPELYQLALRRAEEEEYEEALALLEEARRAAPEHIGLYITAAQILAVDLEDHAAALALLEEAERIRPDAPMLAYARADLAFHRGDFAAAEAGFQALLEHPELAEVAAAGIARTRLARARELMDRHRYEPAIRLLREALRQEESAAAHLNLGICFHALGRPQEAYQEYLTAYQLDEENPVTYFQMGNLWAEHGDLEQAAAAYGQTLAVDPDYPEARHRLASIQAMLGNFEAAANVLQQELERDPECAECHYSLSVALISLGRREEALPHLERVVAASPDDFLACYNLGSLYAVLGRPREALPHLERARAIDPEIFTEGWAADEQFAAVRDLPEFRHLGAAA